MQMVNRVNKATHADDVSTTGSNDNYRLRDLRRRLDVNTERLAKVQSRSEAHRILRFAEEAVQLVTKKYRKRGEESEESGPYVSNEQEFNRPSLILMVDCFW
jgi:hypothetical protein